MLSSAHARRENVSVKNKNKFSFTKQDISQSLIL